MWQLVGQPRVLDFLTKALESGSLPHAYLLAGPAGVGKRTAALNFAQALHCPGPQAPCQECRSCRQIAQGQHPDLHLVRREATGVTIEQVREMARLASLKTVAGGWRIFIVEADFSMEAANAFLKTLEEPPDGVLFLLLTARERHLLGTIRSRCQRLEFYPLSRPAIEQALVVRGAPPEAAQRLAGLAAGSLGWAVAAWDKEEVAGERQALLDELHDLCRGGLDERFAWAARWAEAFRRDRESLWEALEVGILWARDLLLVSGGSSALTFDSEAARLRALAGGTDMGEVIAFLQGLEQARLALEQNANARLALEVLALTAPRALSERADSGGGPGTAPHAVVASGDRE